MLAVQFDSRWSNLLVVLLKRLRNTQRRTLECCVVKKQDSFAALSIEPFVQEARECFRILKVELDANVSLRLHAPYARDHPNTLNPKR